MRPIMLSREWILLYHTLLIGASPLIPIPFLDEFIIVYIRRHLVAEIARSHGKVLSKADIGRLAAQQGDGCLGGAWFVITLPLKEIFREIFFWLEWKRGIDLATEAYYFGYLLNVIFERSEFNPQKTFLYRHAIRDSLAGVNTKLVQGMIGKTFYSSKGLVRGLTGWLFQFAKYYVRLTARSVVQSSRRFFSRFRRKKVIEAPAHISTDARLDSFLEEPQPQIRDLIETMLESLRSGIGGLPQKHFDDLSSRLDSELERIRQTGGASALSTGIQYSKVGIASLVASILALVGVLIMIGISFSQPDSNSAGNILVDTLWLPCLTLILILFAVVLGFASVSEEESNHIFGLFGLFISSLTILSCCFLFGLIFLSSSGPGG